MVLAARPGLPAAFGGEPNRTSGEHSVTRWLLKMRASRKAANLSLPGVSVPDMLTPKISQKTFTRVTRAFLSDARRRCQK